MNDQLFDALEICLQDVENGVSIDAALKRYPNLAAELRPILEAAQQARQMPAPMPSPDVMRRGRAKVLQHAAEMREARQPARRRQRVIPLFQRLAISLSLTAAALMGGTGLVQASSSALPGENLYPVKRTWEDMRLAFVFTPEGRKAMEGGYEQERLDEVAELLREGRVTSITFSGVVTQNAADGMVVSGVPIALTTLTVYVGSAPTVGSAVIVTGTTDAVGHVSASMVQVLPPGSVVPTGEMESEHGSGNGTSSNGSPESTFHIEGVVQSVNGNVWVIDGQTVYVEDPALLTLVSVGMDVEVKGYFSADGRFIVTRLEVKGSESEDEEINPANNVTPPPNDDNTNDSENNNEDLNENKDDNKNDNKNQSEDQNKESNDNSNSNDD